MEGLDSFIENLRYGIQENGDSAAIRPALGWTRLLVGWGISRRKSSSHPVRIRSEPYAMDSCHSVSCPSTPGKSAPNDPRVAPRPPDRLYNKIVEGNRRP